MKRLLSLLIALALPAIGSAQSGHQITLAWDPSPSPNITQYKLYHQFGTNDIPQWKVIWSGSYTNTDATVTVTNLGLHRFVATALNRDGLESDFSNEASHLLEKPLPIQLRIESVVFVTQVNLTNVVTVP